MLDAAHTAQAEIVGAYPEVTGNLKRGVKVTVEAIGPHGVAAKVRSSAPHAWLYEHGRSRWGEISDPPAPVFIPTMMRTRRAMYGRLAQLLEQHGLRRDGALMADSSDIANALIAKLGSDAELLALCPNGVYRDQAPPGATRFVIVSLMAGEDHGRLRPAGDRSGRLSRRSPDALDGPGREHESGGGAD